MYLFVCHSEGVQRPWESPGAQFVTAQCVDRCYREIATSGIHSPRNDTGEKYTFLLTFSAYW